MPLQVHLLAKVVVFFVIAGVFRSYLPVYFFMFAYFAVPNLLANDALYQAVVFFSLVVSAVASLVRSTR